MTYAEFLKRLDGMDELFHKNVRNALVKNAKRMRDDARLNATTFPKVVFGHLRRSIFGAVLANKSDDQMFINLRAGGYEAPKTPFEQAADIVYARVQELGGGPNNIVRKLYLQRARDKNLPRTEQEIEKAISFTLKGKAYT